MLEMEERIQAIAQDTATTFASYNTAVGTAWETAASCTPVADVQNAIVAIKAQINGGLNGARIIGACHDNVVTDLLASADIKDRIASTLLGVGGRQEILAAVARTMGLDRIVSSNIQRNGSDVWDDTMFGIYIVSDGMDLRSVPQVGRVFRWDADAPENALVETYREEAIRSNIVRVRQYVDEKLLTARAGHILTGVGT